LTRRPGFPGEHEPSEDDERYIFNECHKSSTSLLRDR